MRDCFLLLQQGWKPFDKPVASWRALDKSTVDVQIINAQLHDQNTVPQHARVSYRLPK